MRLPTPSGNVDESKPFTRDKLLAQQQTKEDGVAVEMNRLGNEKEKLKNGAA